jgi:hypothetical protein
VLLVELFPRHGEQHDAIDEGHDGGRLIKSFDRYDLNIRWPFSAPREQFSPSPSRTGSFLYTEGWQKSGL